MDPRSVLTEAEVAEMVELWTAWQQARAEKRWADADVLREQVIDAGLFLDRLEWHPVYESSTHRQQRLKARRFTCPS